MLTLWSDGCLLNITKSPSESWRSIVYPAFEVPFRDADGNRKFAGKLLRHAELVYAECRVRRNNRARAEVHALSAQVVAQASFLAFKALEQRLKLASGAVAGGRYSRGFVVEVSRNVVLQQFPQVLDDQLRRSCVDVLFQALIDAEDVYELVRQIVFRAFSSLECNGRANGYRRHH
ncbi:Uncharacterised protein [Candidatus Norongarragalina meridionalis]|nr:Uncharacterised protein [Candidatus Norongarragalina meridionalis]